MGVCITLGESRSNMTWPWIQLLWEMRITYTTLWVEVFMNVLFYFWIQKHFKEKDITQVLLIPFDRLNDAKQFSFHGCFLPKNIFFYLIIHILLMQQSIECSLITLIVKEAIHIYVYTCISFLVCYSSFW